MSGTDVALVVVAALLVPLAGVLAGMEAALVRVSRVRVEEMERGGDRRAARLLVVLADLPRHTNLLLLLRLVCETLATVLVAQAVIDWLGPHWSAVAFTVAVMVVVSYVLVGVGPRTLGRQHPYTVATGDRGPRARAGPGARPAGVAADPHRQRDHAGPRLPRGPVRDRGRAARAGRPGRAARRGRARRAGHDPLGVRARRHDRPRGDGAADRGGVDRARQERPAGARAGAAQRLLPDPGGRRQRRRRRRHRLPQGPRRPGPGPAGQGDQGRGGHAAARRSCRSPSRWTSCCGRCRPGARTWPW